MCFAGQEEDKTTQDYEGHNDADPSPHNMDGEQM